MTLPSRDQLFEALLRDEISWTTIEAMARFKTWIQSKHTKQLLELRHVRWWQIPEHLTESDVRAMLLAELNTREHVPNKQEAKAIRQARARVSKSNRRSRA